MRERLESILAAWGHRAYRHPRLTIGLVLATLFPMFSQLPQLELNATTEALLHGTDPTRVAYDRFREQFGRDDLILIAIAGPEVFDFDFLKKLREMHRDIETEVPHLEDVRSLVNARDTRGAEDELIVGDLLEDWPTTPAELETIKRRALANPLYRNLLLSEDGRITTISIELYAYSSLGIKADELGGFGDDETQARPPITGAESEQIILAIESIVDRYRAADFVIYVAGAPVLVHTLQAAMRADMARFTLLAIAAIVFFLYALFRNVAAAILPLLVVIPSLLTTLSIRAMTGLMISIPTQILPSFLLAVGVGNSVHILAIFYQERRRGADEESAISFALGHSGLAVVMTSLTTAGGLISFSAAEIAPIAEFGIVGPVGVMISLLLTMVALPALISLAPMGTPRSASGQGTQWSQRWLMRAGDFSVRNAGALVAAVGVLLVFSFFGALRIQFSHNPIAWFPEDNPFRQSSLWIDDKLGGSMSLEVLVDSGEENGLHAPDLLTHMNEMGRHASRVQTGNIVVGKTASLVDVVKEIHQALNENRSEFHTIPSDRTLIAQELLLFENSGTDDLEDFVDPQFQVARFTMKVPFIDAIEYSPFYDAIDRDFRGIVGDEVGITVTGLMTVLGKTMTAVIHTLAKSYIVAFLVITPLMVILIGRLWIGLLSMIPNLAPILLTLGIMGWVGLRLDLFTLLIGSIAIGIAVDDTIHFMHNFRRYYESSGDVQSAVRQTLSSTGQAMLFTSLVLATGFFLYTLASMENLFFFGLLTGFTIIMAFLADVFLAPALLALVARPREARAANPEML